MNSRKINTVRKTKLFSFGRHGDYNKWESLWRVSSQTKIRKHTMKTECEQQFNISSNQSITFISANLMPGSHDALANTFGEWQTAITGRSAGRRAVWHGVCENENHNRCCKSWMCTRITQPPLWRATELLLTLGLLFSFSPPSSPFSLPFPSLSSLPPPSIGAGLAGRTARPYCGWGCDLC